MSRIVCVLAVLGVASVVWAAQGQVGSSHLEGDIGQANVEVVSGIPAVESGGTPASAVGIQYELRPIGATGAHAIDGGEITVVPGAEVTLELHVSNWAPVELATFTAHLECAGLESASVGTLIPIESMTEVDDTRTDYVFFGFIGFPACGSNSCPSPQTGTIGCEAGALLSSVSDPGIPKYAATYVLEVSADANGTFTVGFNLEPGITVAIDGDGELIEPINVIPTMITVAAGPAPVPAVGTWGVAAFALLIVAAATVAFRRTRVA